MAVFTPYSQDVAVDMRLLFPWKTGDDIESIEVLEGGTIAKLTGLGGSLILTYRGEWFVFDGGTYPAGGEYHSVTITLDGQEIGTLSDIDGGSFAHVANSLPTVLQYDINTISGTSGDDFLYAIGDIGDTVNGGAGNDTIMLFSSGSSPPRVDHHINGGPGTDLLYVENSSTDVLDLRRARLESIEEISIEDGVLVVLSSRHFAVGQVSPSLHIASHDSDLRDRPPPALYVAMDAPGLLDLSQVTVGDGVWLAAIGTKRSDTIVGTAAGDVLAGAAGPDVVTGGPGGDAFYFGHKDDFRKKNGMDLITDFGPGDVIDLLDIDAKPKWLDQAFRLIEKEGAALPKKPGRLVFAHEDGMTYIKGNTNDDRKPEIRLALTGTIDLDKSDFIL